MLILIFDFCLFFSLFFCFIEFLHPTTLHFCFCPSAKQFFHLVSCLFQATAGLDDELVQDIKSNGPLNCFSRLEVLLCADDASTLPCCCDTLHPALLGLLLGSKWGGAWATSGRMNLADAGLGDQGVAILCRALTAAAKVAAPPARPQADRGAQQVHGGASSFAVDKKAAVVAAAAVEVTEGAGGAGGRAVGGGLRVLDLSGNGIGDAGCLALAQCLKTHRATLSSFCLARNRVGSQGCAALSEAVKACSGLGSLSLACNPLTRLPTPTVPGSPMPSPLRADVSGALKLAFAVGASHQLGTLSLRQCGVEASLAAQVLREEWGLRPQADLQL